MSTKYTGFVALFFLVSFSSNISNAKRLPDNWVREDHLKTDYPTECFSATGDTRIDCDTFAPLALYSEDYIAQPSTPEKMAREYLSARATSLGIKAGTMDLMLTYVRETSGGYRVRFQQTVDYVPVYNSEVVVSIDRQNRINFVMSHYEQNLDSKRLGEMIPQISQEVAWSLFFQKMAIAHQFTRHESLEKYILNDEEGGRLVYRLTVVSSQSDRRGDWEALVDATTGEIISSRDRTMHVSGNGMVFNPDPLTHAKQSYGTGDFTDNDDQDTVGLNEQRSSVELKDLTFKNGSYYLSGKYVEIADFESPSQGVFNQASANFNFTRTEEGFEAVNVYYHIDQSLRYINEDLGFKVMPTKYEGGVQVDPHGLGGDDNSHYVPSANELAFGDGGVDDGEDEDVILHELGHGIHDWITNGNISSAQGLSEGSGDYWAVSHNRAFAKWSPEQPQYNWVFQWDGHNPFWPGRVTNYTKKYNELTGYIHTDGQIWATTLMMIWDKLGKRTTDSLFLETLSMLSSRATQQDAAAALVRADQALNQGRNKAFLLKVLRDQRYNVN